MTQTYIEYLFPGLWFSEEVFEKAKDRSIPKKLRKSCYCFWFYDVSEIKKDGEILTGNPKNESGKHLIGIRYSLGEIKDMMRENGDTLISNLKAYGAEHGVKCHTGNWQPLLKGDVVHAKSEFEFE